MFNNLIESSSHTKEFKRRGSFLLFTTATYVVLFTITGIVSIYAYDAHLEEQTGELELLTFVPPPAPDEPQPVRNTIPRTSATATNNTGRSTRTELIDSVTNPLNAPKEPGTTAPTVPPARPDSVISNVNSDPPGPAFRGTNPNGNSPGQVVNIPDDPPPPVQVPTPAPIKILKVSEGVLTSKAIFLPRPPYPVMAKQIRLQGTVIVQVLIDESGKVVSAKAISGHPLLVADSQRAAMQSRFSPTTLSGQAVKVSGVISYNFQMP